MQSICHYCLQSHELSICMKCCTVRYCSRKCQIDDLKVHEQNYNDIDSTDNNILVVGKALNYFNPGMIDKAEEKKS